MPLFRLGRADVKRGHTLRTVLQEWAEMHRTSLRGRDRSRTGGSSATEAWVGVVTAPLPSPPAPTPHPLSLSPFTGREQASRPECLPAWPPQPAAAGVPDSGAAAHPLPAGLGLLRHLYLQHL